MVLDGVRILDPHGSSLAVAAAGRQLAELGATVVVVEHDPGGGAVRALEPAPPELVDRPGGIPFVATATGKRWAGVNLGTAIGREAMEHLVAASDVVLLSDSAEPWRGRSGTVVVTAFGADGPRSGWTASSPGLFHVGGPGSVTPRAPQVATDAVVPPAAPAGYVAEYYGALHVAAAAIACILGPSPEVIDLSLAECLLPLMRRELAAWSYEGYDATRQERLWRVAPSGFYETLDGEVYVNVIEETQWRALCALIGQPNLVDDPRFSNAETRCDHIGDLDGALAPWFATLTSQDVFVRCGAAGVPAGPAFGPVDLAEGARQGGGREPFRASLLPGMALPGPAVRPVGQPDEPAATPTEPWPDPGRDTRALLVELGWSADRVDAAVADGGVF